ncbi:uncharacterized protein METZ01_LOCUS79987 [marine metagenome]|uniref:Uncharacterized protein n=1 Tax=marine metagenome TaxID=408172 RepID=A0A381UK19_9ZZZZ
MIGNPILIQELVDLILVYSSDT